jgi:hypothetical protein
VVMKSRNFKPRKLLGRWAAMVTEKSCICTIFRSPSAEASNMPAFKETADILRIADNAQYPLADVLRKSYELEDANTNHGSGLCHSRDSVHVLQRGGRR